MDLVEIALDMPWQVPAVCAVVALSFGALIWQGLRPYEPPTDEEPYDWNEE